MTLWGLGGGMVIWIAAIRSIPESFYESAKLEGIKWPRKIWNITIPMCSPVIFYNLVMSIIGTFQTFGPSYIMTSGGPNDSTTFYVLKVYNDAFVSLKMGYASALSWVLFVIIMILTLIVFKTSGWVYYGEDTA
jgi:multiple sugar transport system permease protein